MTIEIFQIDAFTDKVFGGNSAAVCPLKAWLPDAHLQKIALENNLAETAFFVRESSNTYHLRWFTPEIEMDLCGHATLATAMVIFNYFEPAEKAIHFHTHSGTLSVTKQGNLFEMDFPSRPPIRANLPLIIKEALNIQPVEVWKSRDYLLVYNSEEDIRNLAPDQSIINQINLDPGGIIVTSRGATVDFVSRFFTPQASIFEDPVTGSAHCTLVPFWSQRLEKKNMDALQLSNRKGQLFCSLKGDRVFIKGKAVLYLRGEITI